MGKTYYYNTNPDDKVNGANMGPIWGRQDPGWPQVGPMKLAIREVANYVHNSWDVQRNSKFSYQFQLN